MEDIDEQLKINIRSILNEIPEETIKGIIHAVKYAGLESLADLQFVHEEDLILVLKPIQRRKLVKAWSEQNTPAVTLLSNLPLQKCKWSKRRKLVLLQIYAKYRTGLSCPDTEKHEVWKKIADEIKEKCSLNCDELQCMEKIEQLRRHYKALKKKNYISKKKTDFFYEAENAFEGSKSSVISSVGTSNSLPVEKCTWDREKSLKLLEVYAEYKTEFSYPDVDELTVWKKIVDELRQSIYLRCNELDCRNKIDELRCEYETTKNKCITARRVARFMDKARKVFETTETPVNISAEQSSSTTLLSCNKKRKLGFHRRLLEVYAKYKNEFSISGIEEEKVWDKIAKELREKYSYNCGAFLCRFDLFEMKSQYEDLKKKYPKDMTIEMKIFFDDARGAFETPENLDILNSQVDEAKKIGKYVPPHLRNDRNKSESVMESKIEDKSFTIKVSNLSKDVKESDLQELFTPYGTIARIYTIKDTLGQSRGFAFIKFHKTEDAARAIEAVNGIDYNKLILRVEWAQRTEQSKITDHNFPMQSIKVINCVPSLPPFHSSKPSTFNMNNFKKIYSNEDKNVSIRYFWNNFDAENYSIWFCEYLYSDQLTLTFMSCNLIEGMFQRSYSMHKNAFASMCLFGQDNSSTISGIWVWRGHELAFTLSPDWQADYESYSWKKLDPSSEETKKLVNEYFTWSGEFGGKKFNQGKIFK